MIDFEFPPLGPTGEGKPPYPDKSGQYYWHTDGLPFYVTHQGDRPACAFRCHYPGGASPCDEETAKRFIEWVQSRRYARVSRSSRPQVEPYLPSNYSVVDEWTGGCLIGGTDNAGWTLDGYVIPRLASGLHFAEEVA